MLLLVLCVLVVKTRLRSSWSWSSSVGYGKTHSTFDSRSLILLTEVCFTQIRILNMILSCVLTQ